MTLHDERLAQIRHRVETSRPSVDDAAYLLAALDRATRSDPENYRFDLAHDAVGEEEDEANHVAHHATSCDLLVGRGMRSCTCGLIRDQSATAGPDPYGRSVDAP